MDRLRPGRYEAQPRSSSSSSQASSAGTGSSRGAHTPLTSPSLSEPDSAGWSDYEMLMQRGKQVQHDIWRPEIDAAHSGKSKIYERATALSRKTSVKHAPYHPSPDPDDFDDAKSVRSINLAPQGSDAPSFSVISRRTSAGSRREILAGRGSHSQWKSARELGYDDEGDSVGPQRFAASTSAAPDNPSWQKRESGHLLSNAFRDSIASDISFNSITGQNDRSSLYDDGGGISVGAAGSSGIPADIYSPDLMRRDSVDTVRSSEFGEHGRWGRAWANKADDEETEYGESVYGGDDDDGDDAAGGSWRSEVYSKDLEIEPGQGSSPFDLQSGSKLDSLTIQWKAAQQRQQAPAEGGTGTHTQIQRQRQLRQQQQQMQQQPQLQKQGATSSPLPQIHSVPAKEHVVNLTRSTIGSSAGAGSNNGLLSAEPPQSHRHSFVPSIYEAEFDEASASGSADTAYARRDVDQTPMAGSQRQLGHRATDSTSTLGSGGAKVYVYPPSPSGSEASRKGGAGGDGIAGTGSGHAALPQGSRAVVETMDESPQQAMAAYAKGHLLHHAEARPKGPVAPSNLLAQPHGSPIIGQQAKPRKTSGHPAGRPPPPTPTTPSSGFSPAGYADPNRPSPAAAAATRPVLGRARTEAIAAANGRESIVSDLDVETLRLDGSSRRDSTSTINSIMTSRMSIGTVRYEDIGLPGTAEEEGGQLGVDSGGGSRETNAPSKAAWDANARLRPADLPSPRRAFSSPSGPAAERQPSPSRSNTHPMQDTVLPNASQQWGASTAGGGGSHDTAAAKRGVPTQAGTPRAAAAPPPLRQAKSSAALPTMQSSLSGSSSSPMLAAGTASSAAMKPTLSAFSDSSAMSSTTDKTSSARSTKSQQGTDTRTGPSSAEDFLSQGITYHEQGDLSRSAFYFERSARVDGGCVVGMCMFGMALREGWGARKDPKKGFEWIQRAAAKAGEMMQGGGVKSESEIKAIKSELKLSVYELGKCFCYGWGVKMDKAMALEYFELAARLGDADAQAEAGALYASGKGCKKDLKKAAMYYRMAEQGGYDTVGLSWIHKDKYK
ncbi:uncharacterized protein PSFLO_05100 [Pseudozyma flocculosa]|uniref:Uncharacterized protein n=1 Tax=Pseudozyma flocculosa TaxID=84751 RepID=A0A5C3F896_9BASI|nr:uncharacterized protein PSFLO_05100 [Pseudozyma flocculosa]